MAKKKVSNAHLEKPSHNAQETVQPQKQQEQNNMESDASEKLESLKSLNQRLLKEAVERRKVVESLLQEKESLETQLARSKSEMEVLGSEVAMLTDKVMGLELERSVVSAFVSEKYQVLEKSATNLESDVRELKSVVEEKEGEIEVLSGKLSEIEGLLGEERDLVCGVSVERDEVVEKLGVKVKECEALKANLVELEERKKLMENEMVQLHSAFDGVVEENEALKRMIEMVRNEKDSMETNLVEVNRFVKSLKEEINRVVSKKSEIEEMKNMEMNRRQELENRVSGLNEVVSALQEEEQRLNTLVLALENKCTAGEGKRKEMEREINKLGEENRVFLEMFKKLVNEKALIEENLGNVLRELADERLKLQQLLNEEAMMLEEKTSLDRQVVELNNRVAELRGVVSELEQSNNVEVMKIKNFESELGDYKCKLELVTAERDKTNQVLDEQKEISSKLMGKILELENEIVKKVNIAEELKTQNATVHTEKTELESQCKNLKDEIDSLKSIIHDARNESDYVKSKLELADAKTELVLGKLKDMAAYCSKDSEGDVPNGDLLCANTLIGNKGIETFEELLEKIKRGFKCRETKVEEAKNDMEVLKSSLEGAHKKQSFWTIVSSVTTVLAAISAAYAVRGH